MSPLQLTEPMTMVTDYLLAAECIVLGALLFAGQRSGSLQSGYIWMAGFGVAALAALAGGTAHGFRVLLGEPLWTVVWRFTVVSIALSSILLIAAGIRSVLRPIASDLRERRRGIRWLKSALGVTGAGLLVLALRFSPHQNFNQNDLYHVIQMAGLYCLYRGASILHQRGNGSA